VNRGSTIFLRLAVFAIGLIILAICVFGLPAGIVDDHIGPYRPILGGLYLPAIPFFFALYQTLRLLNYIDQNKAFSDMSVRALQLIKYCGLVIAGVFTVGAPYVYHVAQWDDAPGVFAICLVIIAASFCISVFAAVLQRLLHDAIALKSEVDLTV
jgi:hypothetical protein